MNFLAILALVTMSSPSPTADAKATDAVASFSQICVGMFMGGKSEIDDKRFSVTELRPDTVKRIKPNLPAGESVWDVSAKASDAHMLIHYEPTGMCVVEVAEADEASIRAEYLTLVQRVGEKTATKVDAQSDIKKKVEGKDATTSMWKLTGGSKNIMLAITTYPDAKFMIQHVMTVSFTQ